MMIIIILIIIDWSIRWSLIKAQLVPRRSQDNTTHRPRSSGQMLAPHLMITINPHLPQVFIKSEYLCVSRESFVCVVRSPCCLVAFSLTGG